MTDDRLRPDDSTPVYAISVAAQIAGLHPQTLRQYDRLGLVSPDRTGGRNRLYSLRDIERLREVSRLSSDGVNLAGIQRILELQTEVEMLRAQGAIVGWTAPSATLLAALATSPEAAQLQGR